MSQTSKSLNDLQFAISSQAIAISDDLSLVLRNHQLFKLALELLGEYLNEDTPGAIALAELMDCFDTRSDCYLENLQTSVDRLRALLGHDETRDR